MLEPSASHTEHNMPYPAEVSYQEYMTHIPPGEPLTSRQLTWRSLENIPKPLLDLLVTRAGEPDCSITSERHLPMLKKLIFHRHERWSNQHICAAASLMGTFRADGRENRSPITLCSMISHISAVLKALLHEYGTCHVNPSQIAVFINKYATGQLTSVANKTLSTRSVEVRSYLTCVNEQKILTAQRPFSNDAIKDYLLPDPNCLFDHLPTTLDVLRDRAQRREPMAQRALEGWDEVRGIIEARVQALQEIHNAYKEPRTLAKSGNIDVNFKVNLSDGSAVLYFRAIYCKTHIKINSRGDTDVELVEYLGCYDQNGQILPDPFFCDLCRAWYDPNYQRALQRLGYCKSDFDYHRYGVLVPHKEINKFCKREYQKAVRQHRKPPILLDLDALAFGITYGALALTIIVKSSIRIHELQQLHVDARQPAKSGIGLDISIDAQGWLMVHIQDKGRKGLLPKAHRFPPSVAAAWRRARQLRSVIWGRERRVVIEKGAQYDLKPMFALFQDFDSCLAQKTLNQMIRACTFGMLTGEKSEPYYLTAHLLRHLYARLRERSGDNIDDIQFALGHDKRPTTWIYLGRRVPAGMPARANSVAAAPHRPSL